MMVRFSVVLFASGFLCLSSPMVAQEFDYRLAGDRYIYQLQNADPAELASLELNWSVLDYSLDGDDDSAYSQEQIASIGGTVFAYMSIGEAEDYRWYWRASWSSSPPPWLGAENPDWRGNHKVRYWDPDWQTIVEGYLDRILDAGFDGVYLDIVDGWEYWSDSERYRTGGGRETYVAGDPRGDEASAATAMATFIRAIARYARGTNPQFMVVPQNGEGIIEHLSPTDRTGYLDSVDGIGIEDLWFNETRAQPSALRASRLALIEAYAEDGKLILVTDYVDDGTRRERNYRRITEFYDLAVSHGYVPFAGRANRELDQVPELTREALGK